VIWSTSNAAVATVSTEGLVFAVGEGNAIITAKSRSSNCEATCSVMVIKATKPHQLLGLGINLTDEHSNNANYEWYIDQFTTGQYASINCGPSCITMAIKWANPSFAKEAVDAREAYGSTGGGWPIGYITSYLYDNSISYTTVTAENANANYLKNQLKLGRIAIIALDAYYIQRHYGNTEGRTDKFYATAFSPWPHYIIAKGYKVVDQILWFEVYDPYSWNEKYEDGTLKGRDRYYRSGDIELAMEKLRYSIPMVLVNKQE